MESVHHDKSSVETPSTIDRFAILVAVDNENDLKSEQLACLPRSESTVKSKTALVLALLNGVPDLEVEVGKSLPPKLVRPGGSGWAFRFNRLHENMPILGEHDKFPTTTVMIGG
jgi:hypothetical protein